MPSTSSDRLDGISTSTAVKPPCRVATTANITLSGEQTIASVAVETGDRVLVIEQTNEIDNGIWVVAQGQWSRAKDFDGNRDAVQGTLVIVAPATDEVLFYQLTSDNPVVIGTSELTFEPINPSNVALEDTDNPALGDALVGVKLVATGAVARTQHDKNTDLISVLDFAGVVPGTDCTAGINAAIAAAFVLGKRGVYFPSKGLPYYISSGLVGARGVGLYGDGPESTQISAALFPSATGTPMYEMTSCPDWRIQGIRWEGAWKAGGIKGTNCYYGVADQCHVNGVKGIGFHMIESAQSTVRNCGAYYYSSVTDELCRLEGGSMIVFEDGNYDTYSIGIKSSATGNGSSCRVERASFGHQYPAFMIGNGDSMWSITAYVEGANETNSFTASIAGTVLTVTGTPTGAALGPGCVITGSGVTGGTKIASYGTGTGAAGTYNLVVSHSTLSSRAMTGAFASTDVIDMGSFNGGGGSSLTSLNMTKCQIAGAGVNDMTLYNASTVNLKDNEFGVNVTATADIAILFAGGNKFAAAKSLTNNASSTVWDRGNIRIMASTPNDVLTQHSTSSTLGTIFSSLNRAGSGYTPITFDAGSHNWQVAGSTVAKILTTSGDFIQNLRTSAPALTVNSDMAVTLTSNTNLRFSVRGSDGTTRVANVTLA